MAWPTAELQGDGAFSEVVEPGDGKAADGLDEVPLGCNESNLEGVLASPELVFRTPFGIGLNSPGEDDVGVPFAEELKGWKPFMFKLGSSSIRRLDLRKL